MFSRVLAIPATDMTVVAREIGETATESANIIIKVFKFPSKTSDEAEFFNIIIISSVHYSRYDLWPISAVISWLVKLPL